MAFQPVKDAEVAGGYRLIEKLGAGGYGEVWKATAPGGLGKAVKIVYGDTTSPQAVQELRSLGRIKEVRHPFLLSLERIEVLDGQLLIVMELAEGSLAERFQQCRDAGLPGIPRDELLSHLRDAASALDYMAETHGLQHLDVKPQNLLLVGNRIKVADFGLVRGLGSTRVSNLGVTPIYATPEAFDGRVSRNSDQYSLAIVYQEMLTGVRPFPGSTMLQLAVQHISATPLLAPLPSRDRAIIARALAKVADQRFASSGQMVAALLSATASSASTPVVNVPIRSKAETRPLMPGPVRTGDDSFEFTPKGRPPSVSLSSVPRLPSIPEVEASFLRDTVIPGVDNVTASAAEIPGFEPWSGINPGLRPTLFLGLGGLAGMTLARMKKRFREKPLDPAVAAVYSTLLIDTDPEGLRRARQPGPSLGLELEETLHVPLHSPEHYRQRSRSLLRWLDRKWLYGIPRSQLPEGLRPLGRLALVDNATEVLGRIREALRRITDANALEAAARAAGVPVREPAPRIFLVASLTGGTGGGMLVTMAYAIRQILTETGLSHRGLCAVLLYATSSSPAEKEMARVNARATLVELEHCARPGAVYPGDAEASLNPFAGDQDLFEETYVIHLGDELERPKAEAATGFVGDYLHFDASPYGGTYLDQFRAKTRQGLRDAGEPATVRTFGLSRVDATGVDPIGAAAGRLCQKIIEKWLTDPGGEESVSLRIEAERRIAELGLDESSLAGVVQSGLNEVTAGRPDALIVKLLAKSADLAGSTHPAHVLPQVDAAFVPGPQETTGQTTPVFLDVQKAVEERGIKVGAGLIDWLLRLIEAPGKRFKAAERGATLLLRKIEVLQKSARARLQRATGQRLELRQQMLSRAAPADAEPRRAMSRSTAGRSKAFGELSAYCRLWLREVAEGNNVGLLNLLKSRIEFFRDGVGVCLTQLQELQEKFQKGTATGSIDGKSSNRNAANRKPDRVLAAVDEVSLPELVPVFDKAIENYTESSEAGLWGILSRTEDPFGRNSGRYRMTADQFAVSLLSKAKEVIRCARKEPSTAELFIQLHGDADAAKAALLTLVREARSRLRVDGCTEQTIVAMPAGPAGAVLCELLATSLPAAQGSMVKTDGEVILCNEMAACRLPAVTRALLGPDEVSEELVRQVLTRLDVPWLNPSPAAPQPAEPVQDDQVRQVPHT
jgi:serine/threonine protein kinase